MILVKIRTAGGASERSCPHQPAKSDASPVPMPSTIKTGRVFRAYQESRSCAGLVAGSEVFSRTQRIAIVLAQVLDLTWMFWLVVGARRILHSAGPMKHGPCRLPHRHMPATAALYVKLLRPRQINADLTAAHDAVGDVPPGVARTFGIERDHLRKKGQRLSGWPADCIAPRAQHRLDVLRTLLQDSMVKRLRRYQAAGAQIFQHQRSGRSFFLAI
jgi:hypothetical protein